MLKYTISIVVLFISLNSVAQNTDSIPEAPKPVYKDKYGLRVGVDLSKPLRSMIEEEYKGLELVGDFRISHKFYIAGELGTEEKETDEDNFNFTTSGSYLKLGFDWNSYENWYGMENIINIGMRFGLSSFSQTLNEYSIYTGNQYWGEYENGLRGEYLLGEYSGLTAQWLEVVTGIKVELFNNLYLGGSLRLHFLINDTAANELPNMYIPGFYKVTDGSNFGVGYNYTISYLIPIFKKDKPKKKERETVIEETVN